MQRELRIGDVYDWVDPRGKTRRYIIVGLPNKATWNSHVYCKDLGALPGRRGSIRFLPKQVQEHTYVRSEPHKIRKPLIRKEPQVVRKVIPPRAMRAPTDKDRELYAYWSKGNSLLDTAKHFGCCPGRVSKAVQVIEDEKNLAEAS